MSRTADRMRELLTASPIYNWWLGRKPPTTIRAPRIARGLAVTASWYAEARFPPPTMPQHMRDDFRDVATHATNDGQAARHLSAWLAAHGAARFLPRRADTAAERLLHWLTLFDAVSPSLDMDTTRLWAAAMGRHARHLDFAGTVGVAPWRRIMMAETRLLASLAFDGASKSADQHLRTFGALIDAQVLSDGGHIERSPARALAVIAMLIDVRETLLAFHIEPPQGLIAAIDRLVPFLKAVRHPDGGFALMNGATAATSVLIDAIIAASGSKGRAMGAAPHTGVYRLRAGQTTLIADCGRTGPTAPVYRGPASFELSVGKTRLIGNCGTRLADDGHRADWQAALCRTAAHSTLVVDDSDTGDTVDVRTERRERDGARLLEMTHDGYAASFGLQHRRMVYLDAGGTDVRGEDTLQGGRAKPVSVRFHLYPNVSASMVQGGGEVILKPPRGRGWRFISRHPVMLEDSVSFFDGRQHRSTQIVVLGNHEPSETTIKWRLTAEG